MKIEYSQQALEDLQRLPKRFAEQILRKIERLEGGLQGDVKRLTNYDCDYRLRSGDYRVLFDVGDDVISILRILNRKEAYE